MKKEVPLNKAKWIVEPGCVVMISSGTMERSNIMTFSWQTPVNSSNPCLVLLVIHPERYSYELIKQNRELVINVPGEALLTQTHYAGTITGRNRNKFKESGLTPVPAELVAPPVIKECSGHLECRLADTFKTKSHDVLICEVVRAVAESAFFDGKWIPEKFHTLHYLSGSSYGIMDRSIDAKPELKKQN